MSQCPRLPHRILRQRQTGLVRSDIEGKDTAWRAILLDIIDNLILALYSMPAMKASNVRVEPYPFRRIMEGPDRIANINSVAKRIRKRTALGDCGRDGGFEEIHSGNERNGNRLTARGSVG